MGEGWEDEHPERAGHFEIFLLRTLAKQVLTMRYSRRIKSSFRIMIAARRLPRIRAPVYLLG